MGRAGKRAGKWTIREVRRHRIGVVRRNLGRYLVLALFIAALGALVVAPPWMPPLTRAFFAGVFVTLYFSLVAYSLMLDGSHLRLMGAEAERWTSAALRKLDGWKVLDRVEFADRDIDHVAVGAGHVLAVETKWTSRPVRVTSASVEGLWCDGVGQAAWAAERAERLLRSKGVEQPVIPVLALWGPAVQRVEGGYQRVGDVRVVVGAQEKEWRRRLADLPRWPHSTDEVMPALEAYVEGFERSQSAGGRRGWRRLALGAALSQ